MFAISLIIFIVLNLAPGKPGAFQSDMSEGGQKAQSGQSESYKIFKEQFNLDKPILFNTEFSTDEKVVRNLLTKITNEDGTVPVSERIKAGEELEDLGNYSVKPLIALLPKLKSNRLFSMATFALSTNAKERLINIYGSHLSDEQKLENKRRYLANQEITAWNIGADTVTAEAREELQVKWQKWYEQNYHRFNFSSPQKVRIFFTDTRFAKYISNLVKLDFGISHVNKKPVIQTIFHKLKYSLALSITSILLAYLISVPLGMYSAVKRDTPIDKTITVTLFMLYSLPTFFVGTLMLQLLSKGGTGWHIFPTSGVTSLNFDNMTSLSQIEDVIFHYLLPVACMTYASLAALSRYARSGLLEVIKSDYVRTARAKGLPEIVVIVRHAMRNGIIPILTLLGTLLPVLIGGSVIIEYIFNIPGMGTYIVESIHNRDYNAIMGVELIAAALTLIGILLSDICYALVDPRISYE